MKPKGQLTYRVVAANNGPGKAVAPEVASTLPSPSTCFAPPTGAGRCTRRAVGASGTATCRPPAPAKGATTTLQVTVTVTVTAKEDTVTGTASVTAHNTDPNPANNTASITTRV